MSNLVFDWCVYLIEAVVLEFVLGLERPFAMSHEQEARNTVPVVK